jgi:hypothetical protein
MTKFDARIKKAEKFLDPALQHGRRVYERYADKRDGSDLGQGIKRANLFYANVNTLKESLFNSLPKADVSRVHKGDVANDVARVGALIMQRGLDYEIQCAVDFKDAVRAAILDRLVPGTGQVWLRFEMETNEQGAPMAGSEQVFVDRVYWEDFLYGPARCWSAVPWVGRKLALTKAEIVERWGEGAMNEVAASKNNQSNLTPKEITDSTYCVYEIWDKKSRTVQWLSIGAKEPFEVKPDPYGLKDFFPCPEPLIANANTTAFLPVTDYHIAQDQYTQLDVLYARIALIITAIKVAGVYNAAAQDSIGRMLAGQENTLIPVENWAMFAEDGGADGGIAWYPVDRVAGVLQQLQAQYEAIKSILYEITGMSDIVRGSSNQYETAKAQGIKAQFASVRMNGYQRDVAEFVTGILNIMGEMMVQLYSDEKLVQIVGQLDPHDIEYVQPAVEMLRNDQLAQYNVSIQADSLVQADWALEKDQRMELMGYVSQYLQSMGPMLQASPDLAPLMLTMFKFTIAGYRGGAEVEGAIDKELDAIVAKQKEAQMNPQPPPPSPEEVKAQAEAQMQQQEFEFKMQMQQQEFEFKMQEAAMVAQREDTRMQQEAMVSQQESQNRMALEQQQAQLDAEVQQRKIEGEAALQAQKMAGIREQQELEYLHKERMYALDAEYKREEAMLKLDVAAETAASKIEEQGAGHECDMMMQMEQHEQDMEQSEEANESEED